MMDDRCENKFHCDQVDSPWSTLRSIDLKRSDMTDSGYLRFLIEKITDGDGE